jgi:hypothetical protein
LAWSIEARPARAGELRYNLGLKQVRAAAGRGCGKVRCLALNAAAPSVVSADMAPLLIVRAPAIEAIERYRKASKLLIAVTTSWKKPKNAVEDEHCREPYALIHWRNFMLAEASSSARATRSLCAAKIQQRPGANIAMRRSDTVLMKEAATTAASLT